MGRIGNRLLGARSVGRTFAAALVVLAASAGTQRALRAQIAAAPDTMAFYRAMELESAGKVRDAIPLFRAALETPAAVSALFGLERAYSALGQLDALLPSLDTLLAANPREDAYHTVQLRTLETLGRSADARRAFERWTKDSPKSPTPYREYAGLLLQKNQSASADSILQRAKTALGSQKDVQLEVAQTRAAQGQWVESAHAWRDALTTADYLAQAAAYALGPTPFALRQQVRDVFLAPPAEAASRWALAELETAWGSPADGWNALKDLRPDSASVSAWSQFAEHAESEERWSVARDALEAALRWHRTPELALRAARAAMNSGDPAAALRLAPLTDAGSDSARAAQVYLPLHARALAAVGRPADAEQLAKTYDRFLSPIERNTLIRTVALGWVRAGDMTHARATLAAAGADGDSSDAAGWLALYEGNLKAARGLLRAGTESTPELALALGLVARLKIDSAPAIGRAFLALAKNDTASAGTQFVQAAAQTPDARSLLLATAAHLYAERHDETHAVELWKRILDADANTPEAPEVELEWARLLRARHDVPGATAHLEHLILTYPQSALVPQARRELELVKSAIPPSK